MADAIQIPDDIKPVDGRFGSGPSKVRPEGVEALSAVSRTFMGTSHRQRTVKDQVARLRRGIAEFFSLPDGYEVIISNGGTSAFWEVAAFGLIRDQAQLAEFGEFGNKFAKAVADAPFLAAPTVHKAPGGSAAFLTAEAGVDAYASVQNETSTGVAVPVQRVEGADPGALLLTDATSGAGGLDVDLTQTDAYYFAPQKAFGSDGGLWIALMSPAALERAAEIKATGRYIPQFLDLVTAIEQSRLEQTYNTPALATVFLAAEQTDWMNAQGGLAWAAKRSAESAGGDLRLGGPLVVRHAVRHRHRRCGRTSSPPSTSPTAWTRRRSPRCCGPTASWTPSRTASWAATSCGWRSTRPWTRPTSRR